LRRRVALVNAVFSRGILHEEGKVMGNLKAILEGISLLSAGATLFGWFASALSPLAALTSIFWIGFQWYHSTPMKQWRARRKIRH
jgi:hypothetical protein